MKAIEMLELKNDNMKHNEKLIEKIAIEVQDEYQMGGLAEGLYLDFAKDVSKRYVEQLSIANVIGRFYSEQEIKEIKETEFKKGLLFEGW